MSKLNKSTKVNADGNKAQGKAVDRMVSRRLRFEAGQKTESRHQHHKPGSMNMKKAGR